MILNEWERSLLINIFKKKIFFAHSWSWLTDHIFSVDFRLIIACIHANKVTIKIKSAQQIFQVVKKWVKAERMASAMFRAAVQC